jgi:WD40 repeat protein
LANYGGYGDAGIRTVNFSPDERFVITGDGNFRVVIWDAVTKKPVWSDTRHQGNHIYRVILTPDQDRLIVAAGYNPSIYTMPPEIQIEKPPDEKSEEESPEELFVEE